MIQKKELNNLEITLFALYKLGGVTQKIHIEKIAFECFKLAHERFSDTGADMQFGYCAAGYLCH